MLQVKDIKLVNLQDGARLCIGASVPPSLDKEAILDLQRTKLSFLQQRGQLGAAAKAVYRDGTLVASADWYPVESAPVPVEGKDLFAINCVRVADRAARTEILQELIKAAEPAWQKRAGVCVITRKKSFEEFGWEEADRMRPPEREGEDLILYLKKYRPEASAAFLHPARDFPVPQGKIRVDLFLSTHCPWDGFVFDMVRRACRGYARKPVHLVEIDCTKRENIVKFGVAAGVAVNGQFQPFLRPHRLPDEKTIRRALDETT